MKCNVSKGLLMTALITGSVMWGGTSVFAEEALQEYTLDQMVVTATRTEKKIIDVPASVEVVTAKDLEKIGSPYVDDALKKLTGVYVSRTYGLGNAKPQITMRGVKSASHVLVLIDGQPMVNAYSGGINWNDIPVESIEKIEVVKGAASSIYGTNAMAGVISITTKESTKMHAKTSLSYGTNHTWVKKVNVGDKVGKFGYDLYYQGTDSHTYSDMASTSLKAGKSSTGTNLDGGYKVVSNTTGKIDEKNKTNKNVIVGKKGNKIWDEDNYVGKFTYKFDESKTLNLGFMRSKNEYNYDYRSHESWVGDPGAGKTFNTPDGNNFSVYNSTFDSAPGGTDERIYTVGYSDKDNGWNINAGLTDNRSWDGGVYTTSGKALSQNNSKRYNLSITKEVNLSDSDNAVFGVQYMHDSMNKVRYPYAKATGVSYIADQKGSGKADTYAVFLQDEHKFNDKLSLIGAIRYDRWTVKDGLAWSSAGINEQPEKKTSSAVSPKLALNYKFDDTQSAYISWGKAFAAPSLYDMFSSTQNGATETTTDKKSLVIPNPSLEPQIIYTTEAGWKKNINDKTTITAAAFHNKIKNLAYKSDLGYSVPLKDSVNKGKGLNGDGTSNYEVWQTIGSGEGETNGFEIGVTHQFDNNLSMYVNATWQNPKVTKTPEASELNKIVRMTPKRLFNIGVDYTNDKFTAELAGNYYSKKFYNAANDDTVTGVPGAYDPVFLMNFTSKYNFDKHHGLEFSVFNLLDREYYNYSYGQGRNFLLTYSYTF